MPRRKKPLSPRYSHFTDIRAEITEMVERLCELHDLTHPVRGRASETDKHNHAQRAIAIWWYIYARLMQWAQSHVIGYEMTRLNPVLHDFLAKRRGGELDENSHELEMLGSLYAANKPDGGEWSDKLGDQLEKLNVDLDDATLRRVIVRLLLSTSADSSVWRFPVSGALNALNYGEQTEFITPVKRRRGRSYRLDTTRANAISHVRYLMGKGLKKHIALERVANELAVSFETLRDWEKRLGGDDWFYFSWQAAWLAGLMEAEPGIDAYSELEVGYYGVSDHVEQAGLFVRGIKGGYSLADVKRDLRKYHDKKVAKR